MGKKFLLLALGFNYTFTLAQQNTENQTELHRLGALNQNPREVSWLIQDKYDHLMLRPPPAVDHTPYMPPVGNQGTQGSCVAWAVGYYYKTYQEWLEHAWNVAVDTHQYSPAFIYNHINGGVDAGSYGSDAMKVLIDHGIANMVDCPYNQSDYTSWPSENAYCNAMPFKCLEGHWIDVSNDPGILALKQHIADGDNAVSFIWIWSNFDNVVSYDTIYCVADVYGTNRGGHAVCLVGYDDNKITNDGPGAFRLVNSWGTGWGNRGYCWISYLAVKSSLTSQQWVCYTIDRLAYYSMIDARLKIAHAKREWVEIRTAIGSNTNPVWAKQFFDWEMIPQQGHPFPDNNIVLDISEGRDYLDAYDTNTVFLEARDVQIDGQSGTIQHLSTVNDEWGAYSCSFDTPCTIPDNGTPVYANLCLPTQKLHWQSYHRLPNNTSVTELQGDGNSIEILWSDSMCVGGACIADVNGDGLLDVVVTHDWPDEGVSALSGADGALIWFFPITFRFCMSSPCVGDIDGDGRLEIVIAGSGDYHLYALNAETGTPLWQIQLPTWDPYWSSPKMGDLDGDGRLEVVISGWGYLYAVNGEDGSLLWHYLLWGEDSTPCIGDIDGDGRLELVIGENNQVVALNGEDGSICWAHPTNPSYFIQDSPCLGDVDNDQQMEVIVVTDSLLALNGEDGSILWSNLEGFTNVWVSPNLGDIDGDAKLEVLCSGYDESHVLWLYAFNSEDGSELWSVEMNAYPWSSLGDLDDDGLSEVIQTCDTTIYAMNGEDGSILWSVPLMDRIWSAGPALGDIDNDGKFEIVVGYESGGAGLLYALNPKPAVSWYVQPNSPLNSIQSALNMCSPNDMVIVAQGTYNENIIWPDVCGINLISESGANTTILDGGDSAAITINAGTSSSTLIRGLTIQNGYSKRNDNKNLSANLKLTSQNSNTRDVLSCIVCTGGAAPTIDSCVISSNLGAGVYCSDGANPTINYNDIIGNSGYGIQNADTDVVINAENNWWGDSTGPSGVGQGTGDSVSAYVDYEPWLTAPVGTDITPPSTVILISPGDDACLNDTSINFIWHQATDDQSGIDYYRFQCATDSIFVSGLIETTLVDTVFTASLIDTIYFWRVQAVDSAANIGDFSLPWRFEVDTGLPVTPTLIVPTGGDWFADTHVGFEWTSVTEITESTDVNESPLIQKPKYHRPPIRQAEHANNLNNLGELANIDSPIRYILQIDTITSFPLPLVIDTLSTPTTTITLNEGFHYWRIKAYDLAGNQGSFTQPDSFGVDITIPLIESTSVWNDTASIGPFTIRTVVTDNLAGVDSVVLHYRRDEDPTWISNTMIATGPSNWYLDSIPPVGQPYDTVRYYIEAVDVAQPGNIAVDPVGAPSNHFCFVANCTGIEELMLVPQSFALAIKGNPVSGIATFVVALPHEAVISLRIYDCAGRHVATPLESNLPAGLHEVQWYLEVSAGVYFFTLDSPWQKTTGKLVILD